jgi:hypothetical protein
VNRTDFGQQPVSPLFRYLSTEVWDEDDNWSVSCKEGLARQETLLKYMKSFEGKSIPRKSRSKKKT